MTQKEAKDSSFELKEEIQERLFLEKLNKSLQGKISDLQQAKTQLEAKLAVDQHDSKESAYEIVLLNNITTKLEQKLSERKTQDIQDENKIIDNLLVSYNQTTLARLVEFSKMSQEKILNHLEILESQGRVAKLRDRKEPTCSECSSINIEMFFSCPFCKNLNYEIGTVIEHFKCGNSSLEETYENDICPKCRKKINSLGVDYQKISKHYICNECDSKFQAPLINFQCNNCSKKFDHDMLNWTSSPLFKRL